MRKASNFLKIDEKDNGNNVMKKLMIMRSKPHLVAVQENGEDYIIGFIGVEDLVSSLQFCQYNIYK